MEKAGYWGKELFLTGGTEAEVREWRKDKDALKKVVKVYMQNTPMKEMTVQHRGIFYHMEVVETLKITGCALVQLPREMSRLKALRKLHIQHNELTDLKRLRDLPNLEILIAHHNKLESLPDTINTLPNLKIVDVTKNPLAYLPVELGDIQLKTLDLDTAGVKYPPPSIMKGGLKKVMNFLQLEKARLNPPPPPPAAPIDVTEYDADTRRDTPPAPPPVQHQQPVSFKEPSSSQKLGQSASDGQLQLKNVARPSASPAPGRTSPATIGGSSMGFSTGTIRDLSLTTEQLSDIRGILSETRTLRVFREYMESEYAAENVHFWCDVEEYKKNPCTDKAKEIFAMYIANGSEAEVNLSFELKKPFLDIFQSPDLPTKLNKGTFDVAQVYIVDMMRRDNFHRFLQTESYKALVAEAKLNEEVSLFDILRGGPGMVIGNSRPGSPNNLDLSLDKEGL